MARNNMHHQAIEKGGQNNRCDRPVKETWLHYARQDSAKQTNGVHKKF